MFFCQKISVIRVITLIIKNQLTKLFSLSHADYADLRRTMQSDYPFVIREYAEAHTQTLVLCRPDGARKRSVRVLRNSLFIH